MRYGVRTCLSAVEVLPKKLEAKVEDQLLPRQKKIGSKARDVFETRSEGTDHLSKGPTQP